MQGRIGDRLVASKIISRVIAETTAVESVLTDTRFASLVVRSGRADESDVLRELGAQLGVPAVDLARAVIARSTTERVPEQIAREHLILPFDVQGPSLLLAMVDPRAQHVIEEVSFATGLRVLPYVALHMRLVEALARAYAIKAGELYRGPSAPPGGPPQAPTFAEPTPPPDEEDLVDATDDVLEEVSVELSVDGADEPLDLEGERARPSRGLPAAPAPGQVESRRTILVVDDEVDICNLVVEALKPLGHRVVTASRGGEALLLVKSERPDLVLLDAMLPEVHGFEICRKIKQSKRFAATPVLMISAIYRGWRMAEDIKAIYGVDAFLEKPFRIAELRRAAERLLARPQVPQSFDELENQARTDYEGGVAAYKAADYVTAYTALRSAETLEPFSPKVQFMLGRVLEQQDRAFQAIYHYERAVELDPKMFTATKKLALLYQAKGFKNKAVEMWERSLRAAPSPEIRDQIKKHLLSIL